jgi:uncharacterized protein (TIGR03437 family)
MLLAACSSFASGSNQILLRYLDIGQQGRAELLASDRTGNLFTVSTITDISGRRLIHIVKMDPSGRPLASLDFGGKGTDSPAAAAVDTQGDLVVVGTTDSPDFPVVSPLFPNAAPKSAFITKFDAQLHGIVFSTLLSSDSAATATVLDAAGNIYIAGGTSTPQFPVTQGAYHSQARGAFLTEISPDGSRLLYSTYFGGSSFGCTGGSHCIGASAFTTATALALDPSGAVVIGGSTNTFDLPVTPGVVGPNFAGGYDATTGFLTKFAPGGAQLSWSTYLNPALAISALTIDSAGDVLIGGTAPNPGFPTTEGVIQPVLSGGLSGGFVAKLNSAATALVWSTYFGSVPSDNLGVTSLSLDPQGRIAISGTSDPQSLPPFPGLPPLGESYVARLSADGRTLDDLVIGPNGGAGILVLAADGRFVSLGAKGSVWIESSSNGASLLGVGNAASGPTTALVAPSELISIYGIGIGPTTAQNGQVQNGAFTSSLQGYQVLFDGIPAPLLYLSATQINAVVPSEVAGLDTTHLQLVTPSGTADGPTLALRPALPYIFQSNTSGLAAALNQDGTVNSPQNPAKPGSIVSIFASGGGTSPLLSDGMLAGAAEPSIFPVSILTQFYSLEVLYAGVAPGLVAGVMQVNFRLPDPLPFSNNLPVQLEVAGVLGGGALIAVAP